ncbi:MAG: DUF2061 domain-containing protein [Pseudomonadales bacterium]|nr:DUF2061 domain-containing protein [Pseudomonadales bacterium]
MTEFKTLTFTCIHFVVAFGVTYLLTGSLVLGGLIAVIEPLCNSIAFYVHERVWHWVSTARVLNSTSTSQTI